MRNTTMLSIMLLAVSLVSGNGRVSDQSTAMRVIVERCGKKVDIYLTNTGSKAFKIVLDDNVQPPELLLANSAGETLAPFDSRSIKVFDNRPYCSMVRTIDPDSSVLLGSIDEEAISSEKSIAFGCRRFENVPPGVYTAVVRFSSVIRTCACKKNGRQRPVKNIWLGDCESGPFELTVR